MGSFSVLIFLATVLSNLLAQNSHPVQLVFVGDVMLDRGVEQSVMKNAAGDFNWLFERAPKLKLADIVFGNLEGPLSDVGRDLGQLYSFRMAPQAAPALARAGFSIMSLANNHIGDWGRSAFLDTIERLAVVGITAVGGGANREAASRPVIVEKYGQKIGFLAASDVGPAWLAAGADQSGIMLVSDPDWPNAIARAAAEVDALVVSYHFGEEYELLPSARQKQLAELAIDRGARIVIGHHPHVRQPVRRYRDGVVAYSLGNFIFDQNFSAETRAGLVLMIKLVDGRVVSCRVVSVREETVKINEQFQPVF